MVAATGDDEDNLVVSLLAKQEFGMPRVIARVNHPKNEWMFSENWGVDVFVSTPQLITAMVEEAVSVGKLIEILRFEHGLARLVEVTLAPDSPVVEQTISELAIPREATIVAILRESHLVVPRGETVFEVGDEVLALVTPDSEDEMRELLTGVERPERTSSGAGIGTRGCRRGVRDHAPPRHLRRSSACPETSRRSGDARGTPPPAIPDRPRS